MAINGAARLTLAYILQIAQVVVLGLTSWMLTQFWTYARLVDRHEIQIANFEASLFTAKDSLEMWTAIHEVTGLIKVNVEKISEIQNRLDRDEARMDGIKR